MLASCVPSRRSWTRLVGILLIGPVATLLVAWGAALWSPTRLVNTAFPRVQGHSPPQLGESWTWSGLEFARGWGVQAIHWSAEPSVERPERAFATEVRAGWPHKAIQGFLLYSGVVQNADEKWLLCDSSMLSRLHAYRHEVNFSPYRPSRRASLLPLRPMWVGFVTNSLFYSLILFGVWCVPLALNRLRRWRRRMTGRCEFCGYDMSGTCALRCSECGMPHVPDGCSIKRHLHK